MAARDGGGGTGRRQDGAERREWRGWRRRQEERREASGEEKVDEEGKEGREGGGEGERAEGGGERGARRGEKGEGREAIGASGSGPLDLLQRATPTWCLSSPPRENLHLPERVRASELKQSVGGEVIRRVLRSSSKVREVYKFRGSAPSQAEKKLLRVVGWRR